MAGSHFEQNARKPGFSGPIYDEPRRERFLANLAPTPLRGSIRTRLSPRHLFQVGPVSLAVVFAEPQREAGGESDGIPRRAMNA
jgi:hypothetical protein